VVFSGGVGTHPPSEAEAARDIAVEHGVPLAACLLEHESHSTEENAELTAKLLAPRGVREVIVVSDPYHLLRARQYFRLAGLSALPSPALLSDRNMTATERIYWTFREAFALLIHPSLWFARAPSGLENS
jgi:uncharacterized SAM-binding protein YcdF (DUF218 family)